MKSQTPVLQPHPRPYYPWVIWVLCMILNFYKFLIKAGTFVVEGKLIHEKILQIETTTTFVDAYFISLIIFQLPIAFLLDRFGPRRTSSIGLLLGAIGAILIGTSDTHFSRVLSLIFMGIGGSVAIINALKLISNWFNPSQFALMAALTTTVGILGAAIGYPLTIEIVQSIGWRQVMIDYGILGVLYALLFFIIIRDSEPGARYNINPPSQKPLLIEIKKALVSKENWLIALYFSLLLAPWTSFFGIWQVPFLQSAHHISESHAITINSINIFALAIGAPILAWVSTKMKKRKPLMCLGPIVALVFVLIKFYFPPVNASLLMITSFISSFFIGVYVLGYVTIHENNVPTITATVIGMVLVLNGVFRLIIDHIINFFITAGSTHIESLETIPYPVYAKTFMVIPICLLLAVICAFFMKETNCKQRFE